MGGYYLYAGHDITCWHLLHGFQSAFQTFGINHKRYTPVIKGIGVAYSVII